MAALNNKAVSSVIAGDVRIKETIVDARINKILSMRTDSVNLLDSLSSISDFFGKDGNTVEARRGLRHDVEWQNILLAKKFLKEFDEVRQRIDRIDDHTTRLETACNSIATRVNEANDNMNQFMKKATELESRRNVCLQQSKEISNFLQRYELSSDEIKALYEAPIDNPKTSKKFFDALSRLRISYKECKDMVEKHRQSVGFELLDSLGQHQDIAFQRLFGWVKAKCDDIGSNSDEADTMIQNAILYLKEIPVYYSQCQELIAASQRTLLVQRFVVALTQGGGPSNMNGNLSALRAIEMHSHDALRYVGDMLAWTHQTIAFEEELLYAFFGRSSKHQQLMTNNKANADISSTEESNLASDDNIRVYSVQELLIKCLQGLGRPLKVRVMQTLESRAQSVEVLFTLLDLFTFYEEMFGRLLGSDENAIHTAVKECLFECKRLLALALSRQAEAMIQSAGSMHPTDLGASYTAKECARQTREILKNNKAALAPGKIDRADEFHVDNVLGSIIRPLLQSCRIASQSLSSTDMAIYMLNNASAIQQELRDAANDTSDGRYQDDNTHNGQSPAWVDQLSQESGLWTEVLLREETNRIFARSDLDKLIELMDVLPSGLIASAQAGLSQDRVGTVLRAFYASLFSTLSSPQFDKISDPETRESARWKSALAISAAHEKVHNTIMNPINEYDKSILIHSVEEVRVLLGCT